MLFNPHTRYYVTFENEEGKLDHLFLGRIQYHIIRVLKRRMEHMSVKALYGYITRNWVNVPPISSFYAAVYSLEKKGFVKKVKRRGKGEGQRLSKYLYKINKVPKNLFVQISM